MSTVFHSGPRMFLAAVMTASAAACSLEVESTGPGGDGFGNGGEPAPNPAELECDVDRARFADGNVGLGSIPALRNPELVAPGAPGTEYLESPDGAGTANIREHDRVVVFRLSGEWVAVPHNILWWHEIAHFTGGSRPLAVTYCPLTGSSIVFDYGGLPVSRFQVSGLLFDNNLVMRDPDTGSLWPQMLREAACGPVRGRSPRVVPSLETRWDQWVEIHPETRVVSSRTGFDRDYDLYPYNRYEEPSSLPLAPVADLDRRRPLKERVLGIPVDGGGVAYPFGELASGAGVRTVWDTVAGEPVVIFWNRDAFAAVAYDPRIEGGELAFEVRGGRIVDTGTESTWRYDGVAVAGPMEGTRLRPVEEAYVAFWFAWAAFQPQTEIWEASAGPGGGS